MGKRSEIILQPRKCRYCRATFTPKRVQDHKARFCEANHRKDYYRYGGLPFDKLLARIDREVAAKVAPLTGTLTEVLARLDALELAAARRKRKK